MLIGRVASVRQSKGLYILCEGIDLHFDLHCWEVGCQILGRILRNSQRHPCAEGGGRFIWKERRGGHAGKLSMLASKTDQGEEERWGLDLRL